MVTKGYWKILPVLSFSKYSIKWRECTIPTYIMRVGLEIPTRFTNRRRRWVKSVGISRPSQMMYVGVAFLHNTLYQQSFPNFSLVVVSLPFFCKVSCPKLAKVKKSHLEIRSSYGSRDSFFDCRILQQNKSFRILQISFLSRVTRDRNVVFPHG